MNCPLCQSQQVIKKGTRRCPEGTTRQKYLCKICNKHFSQSTDTPITQYSTLEEAREVLQTQTSFHEIRQQLYANINEALNLLNRIHPEWWQTKTFKKADKELLVRCLYNLIDRFQIEDDDDKLRKLSKQAVYEIVFECCGQYYFSDKEQRDREFPSGTLERSKKDYEDWGKHCVWLWQWLNWEENPFLQLKSVWSTPEKKNVLYLEEGPQFDELHNALTAPITKCDRRPPINPPIDKHFYPSGHPVGGGQFHRNDPSDEDIKLFAILNQRAAWLIPGAYEEAEQELKPNLEKAEREVSSGSRIMIEAARHQEQRLSPRQVKYAKLLSAERRARQILRKLLPYQGSQEWVHCSTPYTNQLSGRIQPSDLTPLDISEKACASNEWPGGLRQRLFRAAKDTDVLFSASDCNASGITITSTYLQCKPTMEYCHAPGGFNQTVSELLRKNDSEYSFFFPGIVKKDQGNPDLKLIRNAVKSLTMTKNYGSSPGWQYLLGLKKGEPIWREPLQALAFHFWLWYRERQKYQPVEPATLDLWIKSLMCKRRANNLKTLCVNGATSASEFLEDKFPAYQIWNRPHQLLAEMLAEPTRVSNKKKPTGKPIKFPFIVNSSAFIRLDKPQYRMTTMRVPKSLKTNRKKKTETETVNLWVLASVPDQDGYFHECSFEDQKKQLAPTIIHSIDSTIIREMALLVHEALSKVEKEAKLPVGYYSMSLIHDCILYPTKIFSEQQIGELWNKAFRQAYCKFDRLYKWHIEVLSNLSLNHKSHPIVRKLLKHIKQAYKLWQDHHNDPEWLESHVRMSTSLEF